MGCTNAKLIKANTMSYKDTQLNSKKQSHQSSSSSSSTSHQPSSSSLNECDTLDYSVNRISVLEQCCVSAKIQLQNDYNVVQEVIKNLSDDNISRAYQKLQDKAEVIMLLIHLADEIQERSYQLFDKHLKDEPKLEEYLVSLIWACKKLKFKYIDAFLLKINPFFNSQELDQTKVNIHLKKLMSKMK